jgi:twitching motility protein PilI
MTERNSDFLSDTIVTKPATGGRQIRLREFQAQLLERLQAARASAPAHASRLGVMVGQTRWLLNLQEAGEIVPVGPITKVPLTQAWFLGLINIRGNLVSVIDFANFLGMPPTTIVKEARIVSFAAALSFNSGLLVSRIMGLRNIGDMEPYPDADGSGAPWAAHRYLDRDSQVWTELNLSAIVQAPQFLHVGL